jgi:cell division protein ZapA (FtsZ GTPase activity inhibitor)
LDQLVTIELFGHPFTFKAEKDIKKAQEVADYLVQEVSKVESQLSDKSSTISKQAILILAALNIANEYFKCKQRHTDLLEFVSDRASKLLDELNTTQL